MQRTLLAAAALITATGCSTAQVQSDPTPLPPPAGAEGAILPVGTEFTVELDETLSAEDSRVGDQFTATVTEPVQVNGDVVVPQGSKVTGRITGLDKSEGVNDQGAIRLAFESITVNGVVHSMSADITDVNVTAFEGARGGGVAERAAIGAGTGAVIGAIIGGSLRDALIGGVLGAGAGTIISLGMGDVQNALPEGADLTLRVTSAVAAR
jgi:hypothetical protein